MFDDFANVWTIVGAASALAPARPLGITVAGERVVLFRDAQGAPAALIDRCPHRGAALSLGCVENGEIECPFHGWRFGPDGANRRTPWNPDAKRANLGAMALPVRELGGLLWLYTARVCAEEPAAPASLSARGVAVFVQSVLWRAHWTRVMENMLDSPHVAFVHRRTIGRQLRSLVDGRLEVEFAPEAYGGRVIARVDGEGRPGRLDYRFPNAMELMLDPRGKMLRILAVCVPESATTTRLLLVCLRDFLTTPLLNPAFAYVNRRIAEEDRAIVESSLPAEAPDPAQERSVATDAATLAFRRIYRQRLLGSKA